VGILEKVIIIFCFLYNFITQKADRVFHSLEHFVRAV